MRMTASSILPGRIRSAIAARRGSGDPIEVMRGIAVLLLVSFHVIGASPGTGLEIDYPHPLRIFADLLIDARMPLFAFIAGYVYALRPVTREAFGGFVQGKIRRLAVPGLVAVAVFVAIAGLMGNEFALAPAELWRPLLLPYAHFWFLQAILVIFLVYGAIDALAGQRGAVAVFALSLGLLFTPRLPVSLFSVNSAVQLLPYFLLGVVFLRHRALLRSWRLPLVALCAAAIAAGLWWNLGVLERTGEFSQDRRDLQSLVTGLGLCLVLVLSAPRVAALEWIGPFSFTIYLYHVLGTAGMRELLQALGVEAVPLHYLLGLAAGILFPVALHLAAARVPALSGWVLGLWPRPGRLQSAE
jgi:fucose 4-O-acetylase-like acetyltransferase